MKVAVTGASGLIGSALLPVLRADGHDLVRLVRRPPSGPDEVTWDPASHRLDPTALADVDAVVHLAGVGIARWPWTERHRRQVLDSRVDGTETVAEALASAPARDRVLVSASAVGWYGDTGDRAVVESDGPGAGFLADVCRAWEGATAAAEPVARVVRLRTGLVLSRRGGLLQRMLPVFRAGLGGRMGSGRQYWPWISLADEVRAIRHVLTDPGVRGPVNLTGPVPVTNAEFTATLGRVLHRPTLAPVPAFAVRLGLGGFGTEGVLAGQRALPRALETAGFTWEHPTLEAALRAELGTPGSP